MALSVVACSFDTGSAASTNGESLGRSESSASGGRGESSDDSSGEDTVDSQGGSADETSGDGGSAITGDDPGTCEGPCAADVPGGWDGPFYVATADGEPAACPEGFPQQDVRFADLVAPDPMCTCQCEAVEANCGISYTLHAGSFCTVSLGSGTLGDGECNLHSTPIAGTVHVNSQLIGTPGSCNPFTNDAVPDASWASSVTVCMAPSGIGECEQGRCAAAVPDSFDGELCISKAGEHDCPDSAYTARQMNYAGLDDSRGCSTCSCGTSGGECQATLTGHANGDCTGSTDNVDVGDCDGFGVNLGDYGLSATFTGGVPTCASSGGEPIGAATPTGPVTVCCAG